MKKNHDKASDMLYGVLFFSLLCMMGHAVAEEVFPPACRPLPIQDDFVKLSVEKPSLVMLHNLSSSTDLWVTHPVSTVEPNVSLSGRLQAGNWSALALDKKSFELSCIESRPGHEQQVPCAGLLAVCIWSSTPPKAHSGTFWAGEDMSLSALTAHVGSQGFILPTA